MCLTRYILEVWTTDQKSSLTMSMRNTLDKDFSLLWIISLSTQVLCLFMQLKCRSCFTGKEKSRKYCVGGINSGAAQKMIES